MGFCIRCLAKCLDDDEPSTYQYTKPLLDEERQYFDEKNNSYIFVGGGSN